MGVAEPFENLLHFLRFRGLPDSLAENCDDFLRSIGRSVKEDNGLNRKIIAFLFQCGNVWIEVHSFVIPADEESHAPCVHLLLPLWGLRSRFNMSTHYGCYGLWPRGKRDVRPLNLLFHGHVLHREVLPGPD